MTRHRQPHAPTPRIGGPRRLLFVLFCTFAAPQLGGCALPTGQAEDDTARQAGEALSSDELGETSERGGDDYAADAVDEQPDPLPWQPESNHMGSEPDPLPWQPDPLPWGPDPLPWQPTPAPGTQSSLGDGEDDPAEMTGPGAQPSSAVTRRVEAAIDDL
ncbi:MAG: hypothetical protein H6718_33025 [Polyangiaceae bacterium]|nr:hypothetical protein [Myxococcales bacterium]MCB9590282.1 hypothetical protein [Polyangiaceae bacterium]MCB9605063.1 hypothetical protein [Polyangiaceae bacterium]